jgi:hypothetical protein
MVVVDRKYAGAAVATTVTGSMTAGSPGGGGTFVVTDATGYPATGKFPVVISRGGSDEEKILVASRSGTTFTVSSRGYDGTTAQSHSALATCELALDAVAVNLFVDHVDDVEAAPHSTKLPVGTIAGHDVAARHAFGAAYGTPATPAALTPDIAGNAGSASGPSKADHVHNVPAAVPVAVGTALAEGAGTSFARDNHVHVVGVGAINAANMFAAGVVDAAAIGADQVGQSEIAPTSVGTSELIDDAVTAAKLATGAVANTADIVDAIVTLAKFASEASTDYGGSITAFCDSTFSLGTGGTKYGHYYKLGRLVVGWAGFNMAADGNLLGNVLVQLPVAFRTVTDGFRGFAAARYRRASDGFLASGTGIITSGTSSAINFATAGASATWDATTPFNAGTPGDGACSFDSVFFYEAAT